VHRKRTGFPRRIGLYTSPHLRYVEERIRIDSTPISRILFAKYVLDVWDKQSSERRLDRPRYLQLLFLTSIHAFIKENVDVAIIETHCGGEFDATNIFTKPVVTGITAIGLDHIEQLGPSLEHVAWHKAGIFKPGCPAVTTFQGPRVAAVLRHRADQKGVPLDFIGTDPTLPEESHILAPEVQRTNCSLALAVVRVLLAKTCQVPDRLTSSDVLHGIEQFSLQGRFQEVTLGNNQWFLDGAHNDMSIPEAGKWFNQAASDKKRYQCSSSVVLRADIVRGDRPGPLPRIVIFGHSSSRDGAALVRSLADTLQQQDGMQVRNVIFTTDPQTYNGIAFRTAAATLTNYMQA
jgi:folylpolyglutamate synthase